MFVKMPAKRYLFAAAAVAAAAAADMKSKQQYHFGLFYQALEVA